VQVTTPLSNHGKESVVFSTPDKHKTRWKKNEIMREMLLTLQVKKVKRFFIKSVPEEALEDGLKD